MHTQYIQGRQSMPPIMTYRYTPSASSKKFCMIPYLYTIVHE